MEPVPKVGPEGELPKEIAEAVRAGRKIEAIKLYREATGVGLKEAKEAVEAMEVPGAPKSKSGCATMLLAAVLSAAGSAAVAAGWLVGGGK